MFETFLWTFHLIIIITLVIVILLQRSEGGALKMGGASIDSFMSSRSVGNILTKITTILAILFFINSISLAYFSKIQINFSSILNKEEQNNITINNKINKSINNSVNNNKLNNLLNQIPTNKPSVPLS